MVALPFVLLVFAGLAAVLGLRQVAVWIWVAASAVIVALLYALQHHAASALHLIG